MILLARFLKVGLPMAFLFGLWSCSKEEDKAADAAPCASADAIVADATYSSLWTNVFSGRCGTCHGASASGTVGGPDLRTQAAFHDNLVGKSLNDYPDWEQADITIGGGCPTAQFIQPNSASSSLLVAILDSTVKITGCTPKPHKDPPQSVCISSGSLANLKKWIDNGAAE